MSRNGGYKIIDLKNKELKINVGMVYDGIYDEIESTRKPLLISGLNIDGDEYHDFYSTPIVSSGSIFIIPVMGTDGVTHHIEVADTDVLTIKEL